MKDTTTILLYGVGAIVLLNYFSKNTLATNLGVSTGNVAGGYVGGVVSGSVEGLYNSLWIQPQQWAKQQKYIPVIDEAAHFWVGISNVYSSVINKIKSWF